MTRTSNISVEASRSGTRRVESAPAKALGIVRGRDIGI